LSYLDLLRLLAPEANLTVAALAVLAVDLLVMRNKPLRARFQAGVSVAIPGCLAAAAWLMMQSPPASIDPNYLTMFSADSRARVVKLALLSMTVCTLVLSLTAKFTEHVGEYLALILLATIGMMLLVSSQDLLMVFIALELTSLSLYILAAFNKRNIKSAEAALKYFLFGGMSAAFTLFGISLVYGLSGSTNLPAIATKLMGSQILSDPLLFAALIMTLIGFGFKIAAVPFHLWAPDAYEGAPTPSAALIASGSKVASFFILARLTSQAFLHAGGSAAWRNYESGWEPVLATLAVFSVLLGNLAALAQINVKRLLAYSAIAHAGYALTGVIANNDQTLSAVVYYTVTYGFTVLGAFAVVGLIEDSAGSVQLSNFAGLSRREPLVSFCMLIFMLSLAGIPPLAGFFGKFYVFAIALRSGQPLGLLWLVIVGIATSAISLYYYLQVLKQIYVAAPPDNAPQISVPLATKIVLALLAAAVVVLGCAPDLLLHWLI
jgi:NADH-quinone oxidoreductase subunit N